jgi:acyl-coenzyme A synthetase/AMP-(fatty) acid ligase
VNNYDVEVTSGEIGELLVSTKSMMKGYWNNPKLTERSLFKEFSSSGQEQVYYRTGDLVYEDRQGNLVFQGRNDRQIKVRGYRVELDEVEAVISSHLMVEEAATFTWEDENKFLQIAAAVIPTERSTIDETELVSFCKSQLPKYAIPGRIEIMSEFPRTSSGKIRRNELSKIIS